MEQRRRWFTFVTVVMGVMLSCVIVEIGVRVYKRNTAFQPDPDLIRSLRPHVISPVYSYETDDLLNSRTDLVPTQPTFKGMDYTNNVGLRMKGDVGPRAPGEQRILLLGDSFVEATWSVPDDQRFYRLLGEKLQHEGGSRPWHVINAAIMNGAPAQYILQFRRYLDQFQPDIVVVFLAPNDVTEGLWLRPSARLRA